VHRVQSGHGGQLIKWIVPIRERRVEYEKNPRRVLELIDAGLKRPRRSRENDDART